LLLCSVPFTFRQTLALFEAAPGEHLNRNKSLYADKPKLSTMRHPVLKVSAYDLGNAHTEMGEAQGFAPEFL
jgi:hypothetical protein